MNAVEIVTDLLQVIIGGLVLGAGLPALFAVGIRLASGSGTVNPDGTVTFSKNACRFVFWGYYCGHHCRHFVDH